MKVISSYLFIFISIQSVVSEKSYRNINGYNVTCNEDKHDIWSTLLEDYTVGKVFRTPKVMQASHRYIPASGFYITKRIGEAMELEPHMRPPGRVTLPQNHHRQQQQQEQQEQQEYQQQQQNSQNFNRQNYNPNQPLREVTETDLYLLSAIEKLVYRVDYIEGRLRRAEQMIYYLMAGNNQKEVREPCPLNFTRIGDNCYHVAGDSKINWKSANNACKFMSSHLAEFENLSEMEDMIAYLLNHPLHRGKDFWLGGLNPGLLWIWSSSAKPVNPNTNLTAVTANNGVTNSTITANSKLDDFNQYSKKNEEETRILNNSIEIKGNGRCLRLSYNPSRHSYQYYGQECTSRHHYVCEYQDRTLDNKITKITKDLNL